MLFSSQGRLIDVLKRKPSITIGHCEKVSQKLCIQVESGKFEHIFLQ